MLGHLEMTAANDLSGYGRYAPRGWKAALIGVTRKCSGSWAGKRSAFILRGLALKAMNGKPLDVETLGVRMRLYPYHNTCEKRLLFTPQYFDPDERNLLASRITPDFVFVDVGANVGGYSLFVGALAGPRSRILAIEPQPDIFERLIYNIQQNSLSMVKALDCAVADRPGEVTLFVSSKNSGESSMKIVDAECYEDRIKVSAKTLRQVIEEEGYDHIDAIKIDTESAEDLILEPYLSSVPERLWPKLLLVEDNASSWSVDLSEILRGCGYREVLRTRLNFAWERD